MSTIVLIKYHCPTVYLKQGVRFSLVTGGERRESEQRRFSNLNFPPFVFLFISFYSSLKRQSYDDDYSLKNFALNELKLKKKQRSSVVCPSLVVPKMHQATTNEAMIGVPSRLCSVCGDISTGNDRSLVPVLPSSLPSGIHFGGNSCESCKAFFRRSVQCLRFQNYKCSSEGTSFADKVTMFFSSLGDVDHRVTRQDRRITSFSLSIV